MCKCECTNMWANMLAFSKRMLANVSQYFLNKDNNDCVDDSRVADDIEILLECQ